MFDLIESSAIKLTKRAMRREIKSEFTWLEMVQVERGVRRGELVYIAALSGVGRSSHEEHLDKIFSDGLFQYAW